MNFPVCHEDAHRLHINVLPNHAYFIPYTRESAALADERTASERFLLLSGEWSFRWYDSFADLPEDFLSDPGAETIPVPSIWQAHGYDRHQYTNVRFPFPYDPPYVPVKNPCGLYSRRFTVENIGVSRQILAFEGVDSCYYVFINGQFAGFSQISHSTSEFDITDLLKEGENLIQVLVLKWCVGSYFEDQDKFRQSGIFRDVYILRRDFRHIQDYTVRTNLSEDRTDADLEVTFAMNDGGEAPAEYTLYDETGDFLMSGHVHGNKLSLHVSNVTLWNAEHPALYKLVIRCGSEFICEPVGFREITVKDGVLYVNGQNIKFRGTNRHDSDPVLGCAVGMPEMLRDLRIMKEHNISAVRTSHYPNSPLFPRLCDVYGFYVIAESDVECHGVVFARGDYDPESYNILADDPEYGEIILDRVQHNVLRDKNRPCVLLWSMGNESGHGVNFDEAIKWTKLYDPTRLTHYERASFPPNNGNAMDVQYLDTYSRMYPSIAEMDAYFEDPANNRPYILCEFTHAMGNGPGDCEDYFRCFERHDGACGGFVWEWCDHAVYMGRTIEGKKKYFYGGDFGEFPHDGNFCMDGLVYPDRTPHVGLLEYKNVIRPARVTEIDLKSGRFSIKNYLDFTDLNELITMTWEIRQNGAAIAHGEVPDALLAIAPHDSADVKLDLPVPEGDFAVYFEQIQKFDRPMTPAGHLLGYEQLGHQTFAVPVREEGVLALEMDQNDRFIDVRGENFRYAFNKRTGCFDTLIYDQLSLLKSPMRFNIMRAPTDNDMNIRKVWEKFGFDRAITRVYSVQTRLEDDLTIEADFSLGAIYMPNILKGRAEYRVRMDGGIDCKIGVEVNPDAPPLPRFGVRMLMPKGTNCVQYFGYGPNESYIDKHRSSVKHLYTANVKEMHEDYIRPQENGSRWNCDFLRLYGPNGSLDVLGEGFSFNVSPYTQEELMSRAHNFELEPAEGVVLCIDYAQNGIGSNSCGPALLERYAMPKQFTFEFTLNPNEIE